MKRSSTGAGGPGEGACSGDLLLGALAACAHLTAQAVTENLGVDLAITVVASGDINLRGTLGIAEERLVGFEAIRLEVTVDGELDPDAEAALRNVTVRYCVIIQTLVNLPANETTWKYQ